MQPQNPEHGAQLAVVNTSHKSDGSYKLAHNWNLFVTLVLI